MTKNLLLVGLGGAIGSIARFLVQRVAALSFSTGFPWGTLMVNLTGCLVIGIIWALTFGKTSISESWGLFLMTGVCGGFTTFSAFSIESVQMMREDRWLTCLIYISASLIIGLIATWAGMKLVK